MSLFGIPPEVWFPVVTLVTGVLLKGLLDIFSDKRVARRDKDARREQRLDNIRLTRNEVQRGALLDLQSYSMRLGRAVGQTHHHDIMAHRASGDWRKQLLPEDVNSAFLEGQAGVATRRVRVKDEEVRRLAAAFSTACVEIVLAKNEKESDEALLAALSLNVELQERIGAVLRRLDDDEDHATSDSASL